MDRDLERLGDWLSEQRVGYNNNKNKKQTTSELQKKKKKKKPEGRKQHYRREEKQEGERGSHRVGKTGPETDAKQEGVRTHRPGNPHCLELQKNRIS
jgi:hypothetical protein